MKNILILSFCFFLSSIALQAQDKKIAIGFEAGLNFSDVNYGGEFFDEFLPRADYQSFQAAGEGALGYFLGLGVSRKMSNHFLLNFNAAYTSLHYQIDASVSDFNPSSNRPLSSTLPVSAMGTINYSFVNLQAGLTYSIATDARKGLQISALVGNMIHLNTDWKLDVNYEDGGTGESNAIDGLQEPEYNNLWLLGMDLAYGFSLNENLSLCPKVGFRLGLNSIVDETISPSLFEFGVGLKKWF